jgi:putative transposase
MTTLSTRPDDLGVRECCEALSVPRATHYRLEAAAARHNAAVPSTPMMRQPHFRALSEQERAGVLEVLVSKRFCDDAPRQVYSTLLDEGQYHCSISSMYRILRKNDAVRERRDQLRHPIYAKPELLATKPNQVWSWDITKLFGPAKWSYFYLYVILDIYSRYIVGWTLADRESSILAGHLIEESCLKQEVTPKQLTLHADRGPSMKSAHVAQLLADLGVTKTHSRPYVSDDNPYSESQFRTMKYRPEFPDRFGSIQDARAFCREFFTWYNTVHHHSGIGLHTPENVHYGKAAALNRERKSTLMTAFELHPERFVRKAPEPPLLPEAAWINPPAPKAQILPDTDRALH